LVDPDGLISVADSLTRNFSPTRAREALFRFERLLKIYLSAPSAAPYYRYDLKQILGPVALQKATNCLLSDLSEGVFIGEDAPRAKIKSLFKSEVAQMTNELRIAHHQPDRKAFLKRLATFVDELFMGAAAKNGRNTWCEKTPNNFQHFDFLNELFPDAVLVHVVRDPRAVVMSMRERPWAPSDLTLACHYLRSSYERWEAVEQCLISRGVSTVEVRFEDLIREPASAVSPIWKAADVGMDFSPRPQQAYFKKKSTPQRGELSLQDRRTIDAILSRQIARLGYSTDL
jgi:hypothetical protein